MENRMMTPDEKIQQFQKLVQTSIRKYKLVQNEQTDLILERTMKVIDHKVVAIGEFIHSGRKRSAERTLDRALWAVRRLNTELDEIIR
jgi:hypothetical protein